MTHFSHDTEQFYPTSKYLARKMKYALKVDYRRPDVFDPSAGTGSLLDEFNGYRWERCKLYACEINSERVFTLRGKGYKVIGTDFDQFNETIKFDIVIANPPFRHGERHTLKAWELVKDGGELVTLLPTRLCDKEGPLKSLVERYGEREDLGAAFCDAERVTNEPITLICLAKPKLEVNWGFDPSSFVMDEKEKKEFEQNPLARTDLIDNLVARYNAAIAALHERDMAQQKVNFFLGSSMAYARHEDVDHRQGEKALRQELDLRGQTLLVKTMFWQKVFVHSKLASKATSSFQDKFDKFSAEQAYMEFNRENIMQVLSMFFENRTQIMNDCLLQMFDEATKYHEKNKIHHKGWKTNKGWKINNRIIVPYGVEYDHKYCHSFSTVWRKRAFYNDMDKVLCWLSGTSFDSKGFTSTQSALEKHIRSANAGELYYQTWFSSSFFSLKMHKAGTVWMDFKDRYILEDFNHAAAEGKNWLGGEGY